LNLKNKKSRLSVLLIFLIVLCSGTYFLLFGNTQSNDPEPGSASVPNFGELAFKTLLILGFIIILVYVILYLLKRFVYRKNFGKPNNSIEMLDFVPLVAKKSICVVKVVDRILVLGISENNISKLSEIDDQDVQQDWLVQFNKHTAKKTVSFADQLQSLLGHSKN
jgi:flagellar protein FliO/FliZ